MTPSGTNWFERHVTESLERIETAVEKIPELDKRILLLEERGRARASLYGLLGGLVPAIGVLIYWIVNGV